VFYRYNIIDAADPRESAKLLEGVAGNLKAKPRAQPLSDTPPERGLDHDSV
jgi:hypothetical protein